MKELSVDLFEQLFRNDFLPHGYCVAWQPGILWLHLISDAIIAIAYYSIPLALAYFVAARRDLTFKWMFQLFILFIVACGTTHLMSIITLWEPVYWLDGGVKVVTAGASILTAITLWPLIPQALALPNPAQLEKMNQELHKEILERQQVTAELKQAEAKFRGLLEAAPDAIVITDRQGKIVLINAQTEAIFGYKREALLEKPVEMLLPRRFQGNHPQHRQDYYANTQFRPMGINLELWGQHKDGREIPVEISLSPLQTEEGLLVSSAIRDITPKKEAEAALRKAKEVAEAANQAKSEFLANMSHELRTPLNGILGYVQILNRDEALTRQQQEAIRTIGRSGEHLLLMINDILDLSKIEAGKTELLPTEFHFPTFLQVIADIVQVRATQKELTFSYEFSPDLPTGLYADEKRLRQILLNLLGNAVKFTEQGKISFNVTLTEGATSSQSHKIRFEIIDTGLGIAPENLELIFQPFHQVKQPQGQQEGTGLGLAISRQLTHLMGGEIEVGSQIGQGSKFWFELELLEAPGIMIDLKAKDWKIIGYTADKPVLKVLVVDDQPDNRAVLRDSLSSLGFEIQEAVDGQEGVVKALAYQPDLILMDLVMPHLDGYEATRQIRQTFPRGHLVIIAFSASVLDGSREKSLAAGCDDFLTKPLAFDELLQRLQAHLKLTWFYAPAAPASRAASPLIPPSRAILETLHQLAWIGDIIALQAEIDRLAEADPALAAFGAQLNEFIGRFQLDKALQIIEQYMED
jgi:PAS domain S-box-containing protein